MLSSRLYTLRRNWLVAVVGIVLTTGLGVLTGVMVPASYNATAEIVLLPPHVSQNQNGGANSIVNPYLGLAGLQSMADIVSRAMMGDDTARALQASGVSMYTVQFDAMSAGPVLIVQAEEASPAEATRSLTAVVGQMPQILARLQSETAISTRYFISDLVIAGPSTPVRNGKAQLRAVALVVVSGLILTLLSASVADSLRSRRQARAGRAGHATDRGIVPRTEPEGTVLRPAAPTDQFVLVPGAGVQTTQGPASEHGEEAWMNGVDEETPGPGREAVVLSGHGG